MAEQRDRPQAIFENDHLRHPARSLFALAVTLIAVTISVGACSLITPKTVTPMPMLSARAADSETDALIVMLPGRGDRAEQFFSSGFIEAGGVRHTDLIATDAHFGYYANGTVTERLRNDILLPAGDRGYRDIWLLGVSMGGLGSVLYAEEFPADVDGLILLAPFLGERCVIDEIVAQGGLRTWSGQAACDDDYTTDVWKWLQRVTASGAIELVLGFGTEDRLAPSYAPLLDVLPTGQILTIEGGHNWVTWSALWKQIATRKDF